MSPHHYHLGIVTKNCTDCGRPHGGRIWVVYDELGVPISGVFVCGDCAATRRQAAIRTHSVARTVRKPCPPSS